MRNAEFWWALDGIIAAAKIELYPDSLEAQLRHPEYRVSLKHGRLTRVAAADGNGIDAWLGSDGMRGGRAVLLCFDPAAMELKASLLLGLRDEEADAVRRYCCENSGRQALFIERGEDI